MRDFRSLNPIMLHMRELLTGRTENREFRLREDVLNQPMSGCNRFEGAYKVRGTSADQAGPTWNCSCLLIR